MKKIMIHLSLAFLTCASVSLSAMEDNSQLPDEKQKQNTQDETKFPLLALLDDILKEIADILGEEDIKDLVALPAVNRKLHQLITPEIRIKKAFENYIYGKNKSKEYVMRLLQNTAKQESIVNFLCDELTVIKETYFMATVYQAGFIGDKDVLDKVVALKDKIKLKKAIIFEMKNYHYAMCSVKNPHHAGEIQYQLGQKVRELF